MSVNKVLNQVKKKFPLSRAQLIFFIIILSFGAFSGFVVAQIIITFNDLKDIKPLESYSTYSVPSRVFDKKKRLITEFYSEKRELVSYRDLPDDLIKAIVATEDNEFFRHSGFNPFAILKGAIIDPLMGKKQRGGSTLTQQLAKGLFTTGERTIWRKLIELWYAFQIEKKYSKEEILELYFNKQYFGHGCYGIQSASKYFFNKNVKELSLAEASLLAGLVQAPSTYSPIYNPSEAQRRHWVVLSSMAKMDFISDETAREAFDNFWENYDQAFKTKGITAQSSELNLAPFFSEYIRQIVTAKYGEDKVYNGGLQIYTTLDLDKQVIANDEVRKALDAEQLVYDKTYSYYQQIFRAKYEDVVDMLSIFFGIDGVRLGTVKIKNKVDGLIRQYDDVMYLTSFIFGLDAMNERVKKRYALNKLVKGKQDQIEGALISVNPGNGYIEAMVGGKSFNYANQFNRAVQAKRQMGSGFKPIFYSIGIDSRVITAAMVFEDKPITNVLSTGKKWIPRNYSGNFNGPVRIRRALQLSINIISIQVWDLMLKKVGFGLMSEKLAKFFGLSYDDINKRIWPDPAFALGVGVFSPLEVAKAFCVFPNNGRSVEPIAILSVKDRFGRIIDDFEVVRDMNPTYEQVISPATAYIMQSILGDVLYHGTGASAARNAGLSIPAGGKTGTSANWKDAWFCGFSKNLTTIVWIGFDDQNKSLGRNRSAALVAAPVWCNYMAAVSKFTNNPGFSCPPGVVSAYISGETGLLPDSSSTNILVEYFLPGTVPTISTVYLSGQLVTNSAIPIDESQQLDPSIYHITPDRDKAIINETEREKAKSSIDEFINKDLEVDTIVDESDMGIDLNMDLDVGID